MSKTITLYSASELKENHPDGFDHALEHWRNSNDEIFWMDETIESLKALLKASGFRPQDYNYELGAYTYSYLRIKWDSDEVRDLVGPRAMAWLENNLLGDLRIKKNTKDYLKYNRAYTDKSLRPYSIGKIPPCPFTGYCADDDYLDSLIKDIKEGCTLGEAYSNLAEVCAGILESELDDQNSEEYFIDHAEANEFEFTEDGQQVY